MITIIFGAPGSGKSSLMTHFLSRIYYTDGASRLKRAQKKIETLNEDRAHPLTLPNKPPLYANYKVSLHTGYHKDWEPYYINGYYIGLPNDRMDTIFTPPFSAIFLDEAQRYFNSRKSASTPDWVSRYAEMHRHYGIDLCLCAQRPILIDANVREICKDFYEAREMEHIRDDAGAIAKTVFRVRRFEAWAAVEQYLETGAETYREAAVIHEGDIFAKFDSFSYFAEFVPPDTEGAGDFRYLPQRPDGKADPKFYRTDEPAEYRAAGKPKKEKKSDNASDTGAE